MAASPRFIIVASVFLAGCTAEQPTAPIDHGPSFVISDGAHTGGNEHFYFLPPMVPNPSFHGAFDPSLAPQVLITGPSGLIVSLTPTADAGSELYQVNWSTQQQGLIAGAEYRITVKVDGTTLGFADVKVGSTMSELKNVNTGEYIPLKDGRTLPIKFRIEEGALANQWVQVSTGDYTSCALTGGGEVFCWGRNEFGQVGDGTTTDRSTPAKVATPVRFRQVSVGVEHVCAIALAGQAYCWGRNGSGQLGNGTYGPYLYASAPAPIHSELKWRKVESGGNHTCGLAEDSHGYCWGGNDIGELGNRTNLDPVYPSTTPVPVLLSALLVDLSSSFAGNCAVTVDGTGYCWGSGAWGRNGNGSNANQPSPVLVSGGGAWSQISTSGSHSCGIASTGAAYCWGANGTGQLGTGDTSSVPSYVPALVQNAGPPLARVEVGSHSCALTTTGTAYCWGYGSWGQLGNGSSTYRLNSPTAVVGGNLFVQIDPATEYTCGLTAAHEVLCWGRNRYGELGDGTMTPSLSPVAVQLPE